MSDNPTIPSAYQLERAVSAWQQLVENLKNDPELLEDEGVIGFALREADAKDPRELLGRVINAVVWCELREDEARRLKAEFENRRARFEARAGNLREVVHSLLEALQLVKWPAKLATASIGRGPPASRIVDEGKIPDEYFKVSRTLQRSELLDDLKQGVLIPGAELYRDEHVLRIARVR